MEPDTPNNSTIWKPIPGLENKFLVSNTGLIRTIKTGKLRRTLISPNGYEIFTYYVGDWRLLNNTTLSVHRAVALAFLPNPENKFTVNHKDGVKTHNWVENLEWATQRENVAHAVITGLKAPMNGEFNTHAVLTETKVREIRAKSAQGISGLQLASEYGVQPAAISKIVTRRSWRYLD